MTPNSVCDLALFDDADITAAYPGNGDVPFGFSVHTKIKEYWRLCVVAKALEHMHAAGAAAGAGAGAAAAPFHAHPAGNYVGQGGAPQYHVGVGASWKAPAQVAPLLQRLSQCPGLSEHL